MAAYIADDKIEQIKNSCDIVDIVSETVSLRRAGGSYLGLCPFHVEKTPSFTVNPDKQVFYCFGCGTGGNIFSFVMKQTGMTFPEVARALALRCGIDLSPEGLSGAEKKRITEREQILSLNADALSFYQAYLFSENGKSAMAYLLGRGMTRKMIESFSLGFAPDGWDFFYRHVQSRKKSLDIAVRAGLLVLRKKGEGAYDRFRNRIIIPIANVQGQVIGFGGRVMDDSLPKYLNSPETPVYSKGKSLYGLDRARSRSRETGTVYVVEGYFDRLSMHQAGIENTVATLGTALTPDHVRILKGMVGQDGRVILVYDADPAGIRAAQRSISVFQAGLLEARVLVLPKGYDPDSFLIENGPDAFLAETEKAMDMMTFLMESVIDKHGGKQDLTISGRVRVVDEMRGAILAISDPVARSLYIKQLAERLGVDEAVMLQKMRKPQGAGAGPRVPLAPASEKTSVPKARGEGWRLERQMIMMMLQFPEMITDIKERRVVDGFTDPLLAEIGNGIIDHFTRTGTSDAAGLVSRWDDPEKKAMVARLSICEEAWTPGGCAALINQFEARARRCDNALLKQIEAAEKENDMSLLATLLREKQQEAQKAAKKKGGMLKDR
ncbi:DNA primase [Desulfosarcina sp. OttesenSCG-928-A07]|nr:DNA primase [Desulfosarcina sp. OttesenSCG-928-G17]MDL2328421.1 DNA primase [Desulfosarcina sp. OttesenSCG-928-A07]